MAIYTRTQQKHDIEANWLKAENFIPLEGEIIVYDADENYNYPRTKIGNGIDYVKDLKFTNSADWNENNPESSSYIKNRTHYIETQMNYISRQIDDLYYDGGSSYCVVSRQVPYSIDELHNAANQVFEISTQDFQGNTITLEAILIEDDYAPYDEQEDREAYIYFHFKLVNSSESIIYGNAGYYAGYWFAINRPDLLGWPETYETYPTLTLTLPKLISTVHPLNEQYIPNSIARTKDIVNKTTFNSFQQEVQNALKNEVQNLFALFNTNSNNSSTFLSDNDIIQLLSEQINSGNNGDIFRRFYELLDHNFTFGILKTVDRFGKNRYQRQCAVERIEYYSIDEQNGSGGSGGSFDFSDKGFDLIYYIDLSKNNSLKIEFKVRAESFWLNELNDGEITINISLVSKGSSISNNELTKLAQEQIITPILTKEEF